MLFEGLEIVCVKQEPECDDEASLAALYEDHVVKEELVLGLELLQPRDVVYTLRASLKTDDEDTHVQTMLNRTCSVVLEHLLVDLESQTYRIGLQTYSFRLCEQNQDIQTLTDLNPRENKSSQARLLAVKKTESSKTNKRKAPIHEKREKIAKKNQEPSAASLDNLPSSTDIQEVSPKKAVVSKSYCKTNTLNGETNFRCDKCGKGFNIKSHLEKHINTHMLMKASTSHKVRQVLTCKTCNCIFDTKLLLQEHEKIRHGVKYFACKKCEYATKYSQNLQYHIRIHTGEKPFKCGQCSSAFTRNGDLRVHLRIHTDEKRYKCKQCSSAFTRSSYLRVHLRTHTGEKPYKCSQCSSAFAKSSHLQNHLRTHTGEKPYKCGQCSSAFTTASELRLHLRTHTGEKPFECNICDYKTTRSGALKDHLMSRHSGQKPFGCDACSYRGATSGTLRQHMKRHHKPA